MYQGRTYSTRGKLGTGVAVGAIHLGIGALLLSTFAGGLINQIVHDRFVAQSWNYVPPPPTPQPERAKTKSTAHGSTVTAPTPQNNVPTAHEELVVEPFIPGPITPLPGDGLGILPDIPKNPVIPDVPPVTARPLGAPGDWIRPEDYPAGALREGWRGVTRLHLAIDSKGHVSGCTVIQSSGHDALDAVACAKVTERARFSPARDHTGAIHAGAYDGAIRWQINEVD